MDDEIFASSISRTNRTVSWDWTDAVMIFAAFFCLPGLVVMALCLLPASFRDEWFTVHAEHSTVDVSDSQSGKNPESEKSSEGISTEDHLTVTPPAGEITADIPPSNETPDPTEKSGAENRLDREHPLTVLLVKTSGTPTFLPILLLCFLTGVITAPITEEFVFRVVLQKAIARRTAISAFVIGIPAILFALIHVRAPSEIHSLSQLTPLLVGIVAAPIGHLLVLAFAFFWLRRVRGAAWSEFGFSRTGILRDFARGVLSFVLIFPLLILSQWGMSHFFPNAVTDPVPILILAIGLGVLFRQTDRFAAIVGMHAALNFVSFCGILLAIADGHF